MRQRILSIILILCLILSFTNGSGQAPTFVGDIGRNDDNVYPGYYWGAAGIVDGLLYIFNQSNLAGEEKTKLRDIIIKGLNGIWDVRMTNENGEKIPAWQKLEGVDIYPGKKYGAAGIIDTFMNAYRILGNEVYLDWANQSIYELYLQVSHLNPPHWPYSYFFTRGAGGIFITDLTYGSLGIIDTTLNVYKTTNDVILLDLAISAAEWMYNVSYIETLNGIEGRIIPWYSTNERINNTYTSFTQGNTGAIPILYDLFKISADNKWKNWAEFLISWLIDQQYIDGSWTEAYKPEDTLSGTEFEKGVSGIIFGLQQTRTWSNNSGIQDSLDKGVEWIYDQFISNDTHQIFKFFENTEYARYSWFKGMSGINKVLRVIGDRSTVLYQSYEWILNEALFEYRLQGNNLLGLYPSTFKEDYMDLSMMNGITGVIIELLNADIQEIIELENELIEMFVTTISYYQLENGLWERQVNIERSFFQIYSTQLLILSTLIMLTLTIIYYRKRRLQQD